MSAEERVACSLGRGEMAEREAELRAIFRGRVIESVREGSRLRVELREEPGLAERLEQVIELERACCPFLDITSKRAGGRVLLTVAGPPDAGEVIEGFEALATAGPAD